jgi:hypothetical protein
MRGNFSDLGPENRELILKSAALSSAEVLSWDDTYLPAFTGLDMTSHAQCFQCDDFTGRVTKSQ